MTEAEWLESESVEELLDFVEGEDKSSTRKYRLFYVAFCSRLFRLMPDERSRIAVLMVEECADDTVTETQCEEAMAQSRKVVEELRGVAPRRRRRVPETATYNASLAAAYDVMSLREALCVAATSRQIELGSSRGYGEEQTAQCMLLREIFGNPFRPVAFEPAWRTSDVMLLAKGIYDQRAFGRMPILADALQDAGCTSDDILNHLRDPHAPHVRGCWALDLVLGKE